MTIHQHYMQRGVTLLENMIALLILSVGLLGLAGLQAYTLRGGADTTQRQLAMQQAADMANRIRANQADVFDPAGSQYSAVTATANPSAAINCSTTVCTPAQLAQYDIAEWQTRNNDLLPGNHAAAGGYVVGTPLRDVANNTIPLFTGTGGVGPQRMRFTITMRWDANRAGTSTGTGCDPDVSTDLKCYSLVIDL